MMEFFSTGDAMPQYLAPIVLLMLANVSRTSWPDSAGKSKGLTMFTRVGPEYTGGIDWCIRSDQVR